MQPDPSFLTSGSGDHLTISGEVDEWSRTQFADALNEVPPVRFLDLSQVSFFDLYGAELLAHHERRLAQVGATLQIVAASAAVIRALVLHTRLGLNQPPPEG